MSYVIYDPKYVPAAFGLNNTGAICWCNSIVQILLSCSSLSQVLLECENELRDNVFAAQYIKLLKQILHLDANGKVIGAVNPGVDDAGASALAPGTPTAAIITQAIANASTGLLVALEYQMRVQNITFAFGRNQECVDEAFSLFLDMFGCDRVNRLFSNIYELTIRCVNCSECVSSVRDRSYRIQFFTGQQFTHVGEFCDYIRNHPSDHDEYKCDKCGYVMRRFARHERLRRLSEVVILLFNKFNAKDNRWFPDMLEFESTTGSTLKYKLVGQAEHGGTMFGGHYFAKCLRPSADGGSAHYFNDSAVGPDKLGPTESTYLIAYHLVST